MTNPGYELKNVATSYEDYATAVRTLSAPGADTTAQLDQIIKARLAELQAEERGGLPAKGVI